MDRSQQELQICRRERFLEFVTECALPVIALLPPHVPVQSARLPVDDLQSMLAPSRLGRRPEPVIKIEGNLPKRPQRRSFRLGKEVSLHLLLDQLLP